MSFTDPDAPVPTELRTPEFVLRPVTAADAELDYAAVIDTREYLKQWQQGTWPADDFTVDENRKDLAGMEERTRAHRAFDYTVLDPDGTMCLGCVYVFPTNATFLKAATVTPTADQQWTTVDAVVYFWMRPACMDAGMDARLLAALRTWFRSEWGLQRVAFAVREPFARQVALLRATDLTVTFELHEEHKAGKVLVFADQSFSPQIMGTVVPG